ncbi:MAG: Metacaspase [uncultured Sulfurovum sp.]|uniref:Metacaspase n=1 Tax=uncultured Sulfurovum sp. TaxID=269237 RepID=A0A6S6SD05_9BACT|nr:MAG: Metacaspase [uncultured Sulfurovum sp.]
MAKGISIHIGLEYIDPEHYGSDGALRTCGKDCLDMKALAESQNYEESIVLLNEEGTREAVTTAITNAAETLAAGDILFISYSGHGTAIPDETGDEEDGKDETWCLFDGLLLDDELHALWTRFAEGVRIMVVSDSCHSGTVTKVGPGQDPKEMLLSKHFPDEEAERIYIEHKSMYLKIKQEASEFLDKEVKASVKLIAGCQDVESSYVLPHDENSLLTKELNRIWDAGQFVGTTDEFFNQIKESVEVIAHENRIYQMPNHYTIGKTNEKFNTQKPFGIYEAM